MRIDFLTLHNYRCFDDVRIEFNDRLTVLVAPNGGGKTAILDAIAVAFSPFVGKTGTAKGKKFRVQDSRRTFVSAGSNGAKTLSPFQEIVLEATGELEGQEVSWKRRRLTEKGDTTSREASFLADCATRLLRKISDTDEAPKTVLPIIAHYGTGRLWGPGQFRVTEKGKALLPRNFGYQGCLSSSSKFESFKAWFGAAYFSMLAGRIQQLDSGISTPEQGLLEDAVNNVRSAVRSVLKPYGDCWLDYESTKREIVITDGSRLTQLGLDQQSDGVQVMLAMVGDIASRTSLLNPQFGDKAAECTPGIVLIDEVDMHLHPSWQQMVLQSLRDAFPNVQFIVTTHSPQVLTTIRKENIRILACDEDGKWTARAPAASPLARESGDALANIMGTHPRPEISNILPTIHDYEQLVRSGHGDSDEARKIKAQLDAEGFEFSAAEQALFNFLTRKANRLEADNP